MAKKFGTPQSEKYWWHHASDIPQVARWVSRFSRGLVKAYW